MPKRHRVDQGHGGHEGQTVQQHGDHQRQEAVLKSGSDQTNAAHQVQHGKHPLCGEVSVCNQPDKQRRDNRAHCRHGCQPADLRPGESQRLAVPGNGHPPTAPHKELQKHHCRKPRADQRRVGIHGFLPGSEKTVPKTGRQALPSVGDTYVRPHSRHPPHKKKARGRRVARISGGSPERGSPILPNGLHPAPRKSAPLSLLDFRPVLGVSGSATVACLMQLPS